MSGSVLQSPPDYRRAFFRVASDGLFLWANYVEACWWGALGVAALTRRSGLLGAALIAFGISDLVETRTGAWYSPWWLLVWKGMCVICIVAIGLRLRRRRKQSQSSPET